MLPAHVIAAGVHFRQPGRVQRARVRLTHWVQIRYIRLLVRALRHRWLTVALALAVFGLSLLTMAYLIGRISGCHINPAVTIGVAAIGDLPVAQVPVYLAGQFAGAFLGAVLVWLAYLPHWEPTEDPAAKLSVFCTMPAIRSETAGAATVKVSQNTRANIPSSTRMPHSGCTATRSSRSVSR